MIVLASLGLRRTGATLASMLILLLALTATAAGATLKYAPALAPVGTQVNATATGLSPNTSFTLVWHTAEPEWLVPDGVHFKGFRAPEKRVSLLAVKSDSDGKAQFSFNVPEDFGRLHNTTLEANGESVARQGFLIQPSVTVRPTAAPEGTPLHVTMYGLAYGNYSFMYGLLYDNKRTGNITAVTTHGTAEMTIPAVGDPGTHSLRFIPNAFGAPYLNTQQSPVHIPSVSDPLYATFTITEGPAVLPPAARDQQLPRILRIDGGSSAQGGPGLWTDYRTGHVGDSLTIHGAGFPAGGDVALTWWTTVGSRVGGRGWQEQDSPLASVTADAEGAFVWRGNTPDDLGGEHKITAAAGDQEAETSYAISPNVVAFGPAEAAPGEQIRIQIKGIGWTETENIITLVHDNAYVGYACGFNSQGDVTILMPADQRPGLHFIDLYPAIYKGDMGNNPADPFRLPMLNVVDHPNVRLPAFHLAYRVVEP